MRKALSRQVKHARAFARRLAEVAEAAGGAAALAGGAPVSAAPSPGTAGLVGAAADPGGGAARGRDGAAGGRSFVFMIRRAHARWVQAAGAFDAAFAEGFERAREALRRMYADDPRLQEAVFLESPEAYERIRQLVAAGGPRNARARQRERLAALYAQRFCAKNDTNSICGPHGLADLSASGGEASASSRSPPRASGGGPTSRTGPRSACSTRRCGAPATPRASRCGSTRPPASRTPRSRGA